MRIRQFLLPYLCMKWHAIYYIYIMSTLQVNILNPKAAKLLKTLADLNLISIKEEKDDEFLKVVNGIRKKAKSNPISFDDITKEVEAVRTARYAKSKR